MLSTSSMRNPDYQISRKKCIGIKADIDIEASREARRGIKGCVGLEISLGIKDSIGLEVCGGLEDSIDLEVSLGIENSLGLEAGVS